MKSLAVLGLLASLACAQDSTSSSSNPLIPSNISSGCLTFINQLNSNSDLQQCLGPLLTASTSGTGTSTLNAICSASPCDATLIASQLSQFQQSCQDELVTSKNQQVILIYDALYMATPMQKAMCQKDTTSGDYCVSKFITPSSKRAALDRRDTQQVFTPDVNQWNQKYVAFLGINPNLSADKLCVPCTRQVMGVYTTQLGNQPYTPGLQSSQLLASEQGLYTAINSKCPSSFLSGQVQAAGGLSTGAASRSADGGFAFVGSAIAAAAAGAAALL